MNEFRKGFGKICVVCGASEPISTKPESEEPDAPVGDAKDGNIDSAKIINVPIRMQSEVKTSSGKQQRNASTELEPSTAATSTLATYDSGVFNALCTPTAQSTCAANLIEVARHWNRNLVLSEPPCCFLHVSMLKVLSVIKDINGQACTPWPSSFLCSGWSCSVCTALNDKDDEMCAVCGEVKCDRCTMLGKAGNPLLKL